MPIEFWRKTEKLMCAKMKKNSSIQTCSQAKTSSTKLTGSAWSREGAKSKSEARKTTCHDQKRYYRKTACIRLGRAGLRRKHADCIDQPSDVTRRISERSKIPTGKTNNLQHTNAMHDRGINNDKSFSPDVLLQPDPLHTPLAEATESRQIFPQLTKLPVLI